MWWTRTSLAHLPRDTRGTSVLELAFVMPLIILMILGMADLALGVAEKMHLEQAAARTLERGTSATSRRSDYTYLRDEAAAASGQPLTNVSFDQWLECDSVRAASFTSSCTPGQQIARYLSIEITKQYSPMFNYSSFARLFGGQGLDATYRLVGDAAVRVQ